MMAEAEAAAAGCDPLEGVELGQALADALQRGGAKEVLCGAQLLAALESGPPDVDGHVVLVGKTEAEAVVRRLPDGLRVRGCLVVYNAADATLAFPPRLTVDQALGLAHAPHGGRQQPRSVSFGEALHVGGCLHVSECAALTRLPKDAHLGRLEADSCTGLTAIEDGLTVDGDVLLFGCTALTTLPRNLQVDGRLDLTDCAALGELPQGLQVEDALDLTGCAALETAAMATAATVDALRASIGPECDLLLRRWTRLRALPAGMHVGGDLSLEGCAALERLPKDLRVGGDLDARGCSALTRVSEGLDVDGDVDLAECSALEHLPADMRIGGTLRLSWCMALSRLPEGLAVGGALHADNCRALRSLPEALSVGGDLRLEHCVALESIPGSVLAWPVRQSAGNAPHEVFLNGSGLSESTRAWLREADAPGLRFHVDNTDIAEPASPEARFASVEEAAAFWHEEAQVEGSPAPRTEGKDATLVRFLTRLRDAKEFGILETRKALAKRVVAVLELLGRGEHEEELLLRMGDSLDACGDKPVWALNQMRLVVEVANARGNARLLRDLGRRVMRLMVVHEHAKRKVDSLRWVDDVCVYLRFEIDLREALDLPVDATAMIFPSYIDVTDEELEAAKTEALAITDAQFEAWLAQWPEWQRQARHEVASKLDWKTLPQAEQQQQTNLLQRMGRRLSQLFTVTGDNMTDPVQLHGSLWSLSDLLRHWERTGLDLNNSAVSPDQLQRDLRRCVKL